MKAQSTVAANVLIVGGGIAGIVAALRFAGGDASVGSLIGHYLAQTVVWGA